jgi:hypothetical protein
MLFRETIAIGYENQLERRQTLCEQSFNTLKYVDSVGLINFRGRQC